MSSFLTNPEDIQRAGAALQARWLQSIGITATLAQINALADVELGLLSGLTAAAAELNTLDGYLGSVHHLNGLVPSSKFTLFDDFYGDTLEERWIATAGSDSPAAVAINEQAGGVARLTTGDSNASLAADGVQLTSYLNWQADKGGLVFETRLKTDAITSVQIFAGLTDQRSALEMPFTLGAGDALTSNATDAVGYLFDTDADTDNIWLVGVANNVDATKQNSAQAYAAGTWKRLRIEVSSTGEATFYIDGTAVGSAMSGATRANVPLCPVICARSLTTTARNVDVDYIYVQQNR